MSTIEGAFDKKELRGISEYIQSLKKISLQLDRLGRLVAFITFFNIAILIAVFFFLSTLGKFPKSLTDSLLFWRLPFFFSFISSIYLIAMIFMFENIRRRGDTLFDEIVDELKWDVRGTSKEIADERPDLDTRMILRSFVKSEELPLIPGKFGPAIYILLNLFLLLVYFILQPAN